MAKLDLGHVPEVRNHQRAIEIDQLLENALTSKTFAPSGTSGLPHSSNPALTKVLDQLGNKKQDPVGEVACSIQRISKRSPNRGGDVRFKLRTRSVSAIMAEICGIVEGPRTNRVEYQAFERICTTIKRASNQERLHFLGLERICTKLYNDAIPRGCIVIGPVHSLCDEDFVSTFRPHLIIGEEAGKLSGPDVWPIVTHFMKSPNDKLITPLILVGDPKLTSPNVTDDVEDNQPASQLALSILQRLQLQSVDCFSMMYQHRMPSILTKVINQYFYLGEMILADKVFHTDARPNPATKHVKSSGM